MGQSGITVGRLGKKKKKNQDLNSLPGLFQTCE